MVFVYIVVVLWAVGVALAIIFDRIAQEYGRRIQKHRGYKK